MEMSNGKHETKDPRFRKESLMKSFKMFRICFAFTIQGWTEALNGPTFSDLRLIIQEDLDTSSWLFTVTSLGILAGSSVASFLLRIKQRNIVFASTLLCYATGVAFIPWCPHFYLMLAVKFFVGAFSSILSTGYYSEVATLDKDKAGFYLQILGFSFSLGGMISPWVARPFLALEKDKHSSIHCNASLDNVENITFSRKHEDITNLLNNHEMPLNKSIPVHCDYQLAETKVMYVYLITAVALTFAAMMFAAASVIDKTNRKETSVATDKLRQNTMQITEEIPHYKRIMFISLMSLLLFLYIGSEVTFAGYLSSFTSIQLNWSQSKGAVVTSIFWISFGIARFVGIWLTKILKTITLMFTFPSVLVVSFSLFLPATLKNNDLFIMICVGMIGVSMSVIFSSIFTWTSENITVITDQISAFFIASCSVGSMVFPLLFGYMMELYSPLWFNHLLICIGVMWLIAFTITFILSKHLLTSQSVKVEIAEKNNLLQM